MCKKKTETNCHQLIENWYNLTYYHCYITKYIMNSNCATAVCEFELWSTPHVLSQKQINTYTYSRFRKVIIFRIM